MLMRDRHRVVLGVLGVHVEVEDVGIRGILLREAGEDGVVGGDGIDSTILECDKTVSTTRNRIRLRAESLDPLK